MAKILISDLKPGMKIVRKDGSLSKVAGLRKKKTHHNGRTVYSWNVINEPGDKRHATFFIGCGDLTVSVDDDENLGCRKEDC